MDNLPTLLEFPMAGLNIVGLLTLYQKPLHHMHILSVLMISLIWVQIFIMSLQYFYMGDVVMDYIKNSEGMVFVLQTAVKWVLCIYQKDKYKHLINMTKEFWGKKNCSIAVQQEIEDITKVAVFLEKLHRLLGFLIYLSGIIISLIFKDILNAGWNMDNNALFKFYWIITMINSVPLLHFATCYDGLFLGLSYEAVVECKVLCYHLQELSVSKINSVEDLKEYHRKVNLYNEHYKYLLRFQSEFQDLYSIPLMFQYIGSAPLLCIELYMLTYVTGFLKVVRHATSLIAASAEASMYCIPAHHLCDELSTIANAAYNSDWYSKNIIGIRTPFLLMTQRAQRKVAFTACGLIEINLVTLVKMFKFAVTTWITLKNLKK